MCGVPKPAWRYPRTRTLPLQPQISCKKLGACLFSMQMLVHVETLLLSHPWSRVATGRDAGRGDGVPCGNSSGSAGKGFSSLWVGGRDVSRGCAGQAGVCLGRRRQACCLGAASCCCRCLGDNGVLFAFLLAPRCLDGWHHLVCGAVRCCGLRPVVPTISPSRCSGGISHGHAANAPGAPSLLGTRLRFSLLSLLRPLPWHEPCGSSGSHPCLHTTGGLRCLGDAGYSCWEGPIFCPATRRAWGGLLYLALLCKASPAVLAVLP